MAKEIKDDEIDFTDISTIKTPEQFSAAAKIAAEKLSALDVRDIDGLKDVAVDISDGTVEEISKEAEEEKPAEKAAEKPVEKKAEEPAKKDDAAAETKADAESVDDDLKAHPPETQKLVMVERQKAKDALAAAEAAKTEAATTLETTKTEYEGKQKETLRLSEVNQDRAGFAQVISYGREKDAAIEKKEAELVAAAEAGDTKKEAAISREIMRLEIEKKEVDEVRGLYVQKYGVDDKGNVNFRALEAAAPEKPVTETKPDTAKDKPVVTPPAEMQTWYNNNAAVLKANAGIIDSIGQISTAVQIATGLSTTSPEYYEEFNRAVKMRHGLELVGIKKPEDPKPEPGKTEVKLRDIPDAVAPVNHDAPAKSNKDEVPVTAMQRKLHAEGGGDPNDAAWLKRMAEQNRRSAAKNRAENS